MPTNTGMGLFTPPLDSDHDIDLKGGKFNQSNAAQLRAAFSKFASGASDHICVFFHGGLVSRDNGLQTASELIQGYTTAGAYPFFFLWNSDLQTVIEEILHPHEHDHQFVEAANRAVTQVARKITAVLDKPDLKAAATARARSAPMELKDLAKFAEAYNKAWSESSGAQLSVSPKELLDFGNWLLKSKPAAHQRVLFTTSKVRGPKNPLGRIIERLNSGHGHGLYTTVVEELFIAIGLADKLGDPIWGQMKRDIDAAFTQDANAGGTAFLQNLDAVWKQKPNLKLTLIGHSAGAIYLQRFVEAFDKAFGAEPGRQLEVITLAAAVTFERMNDGLPALKRRVSGARVFGLSDKREGGYSEVPFVYNKSLLYIVSSLCEDDPEADKPLVGMERYWSGKRLYDQPYINAVVDFLNSRNAVWAPSTKAAPGYRSDAKRHGGFPTEKLTNESVCYALEHSL